MDVSQNQTTCNNSVPPPLQPQVAPHGSYSSPPPPSPAGHTKKFWGYCGCFSCGCLVIFPLLLIITLFLIGFFSRIFEKELTAFSAAPPPFQKQLLSGSGENPEIAVINVHGVILSGDGLHADVAESNSISSAIRFAAADPYIYAIVLDINSPGGEVVAADKIHHAIAEAKVQVPVVAYLDSIAASGGYYVAAPCDRIVAHELCTTGSIGVIMSSFKYYNLLNKIGVEEENFTSGNKKDILSGSRPTTPEEHKIIQELLDVVYNRFVEVCVEGRPNLTAEKIRNSIIGDGRILSAPQALELGLVDNLGYFDDAVAAAAQLCGLSVQDCDVVQIEPSLSLDTVFAQLFGVRTETPILQLNVPGLTPGMNLPEGRFYYLPGNW